VATGGDDKNMGEVKGFAGLSSLVSEVDSILEPPVQQKSTDTTVTPLYAERDTALESARPRPEQKQQPQMSSRVSSGGHPGKWVLGIAAVIGVLWLIFESNNPPSSEAPNFSAPSQNSSPSYSASPSRNQAPSRPEEVKPPIGQDRTLSTAQIRYCLAEDIRLEGARSAINNYSNTDVDRFNAMVTDYNIRCSSYRYRTGALESARRDVESYRSRLQAEGRNRFTSSPMTNAQPETSSVERRQAAPDERQVTSSRQSTDTTVRDIQRKLNELGYDSGVVDGLMGRRTRSAIMEFQRDSGLPVDGLATDALLRQLESSPIDNTSVSPSAPSSITPSRNHGGLPDNARLNYLGNGWECNRGYSRVGNECRAVEIPQNASLNYLGNGWGCNRGYSRVGNECRAVEIPHNASLNYLGNGWGCNRGYSRVGNECRAVEIPHNASLNYLGNGWECNRGYSRTGNECRAVQIPHNASLNYLGNGWGCNRGFSRTGNECRAVQIPHNASLNYLGNGWECNRGFRRVGLSCEIR
jgi:hypothetical protein